MQVFKNTIKYFCFALLSVLLCFTSGCGKRTPPSPPKSRSELVLEILEVLRQKEHALALKKISRLRELNPTNVFLANLEISERNNMIIVLAQKEINERDLKSALEKINDGIRKYGRHNDLMIAQKKLAVASKINDILGIFKQPKDSAELLFAANQLKEIGTKYKPAAPFVSIADQKIVEAKKMNEWETKRAVDSFCSYIDMMLEKNDPDVRLLFAVLEVIDPLSPTLLNYLDYLEGNEEVSLLTHEDIFLSDDSEGMDDSDSDNIDSVKKTGEEIKSEKKVENKQIDDKNKTDDKTEKKKAWWNKFNF